MSNNSPNITICIGSRSQLLEGVDILNRLLAEGNSIDLSGAQPTDDDPLPNPTNAAAPADVTPAPVEENLSPQQKAARTRKVNKLAKEQAAAAAAGPAAATTQPAPAPTQPAPMPSSGPVSPQPAPVAPAPAVGPVTDEALLEEARGVHARLGVEGRGQEMINVLLTFGVQNISALPMEHRANFLTQIRAL